MFLSPAIFFSLPIFLSHLFSPLLFPSVSFIPFIFVSLLYLCSSFFLASNFCLFMHFFPYSFHCPTLPSFFLTTTAKCRPVPPSVYVSSVQYLTKRCHTQTHTHTHLTFIPVPTSSHNYGNSYLYIYSLSVLNYAAQSHHLSLSPYTTCHCSTAVTKHRNVRLCRESRHNWRTYKNDVTNNDVTNTSMLTASFCLHHKHSTSVADGAHQTTNEPPSGIWLILYLCHVVTVDIRTCQCFLLSSLILWFPSVRTH